MSERRDSFPHSGDRDDHLAGGATASEDSRLALELLLAVSDCLRSWSSFDADAERLLRVLAGGLAHPAAALWLPDGDELVARAVWCSGSVDRGALEEVVLPSRIPRGVGLPGHVWMNAEPATAESIATDGMPEIRGLRGALGIPAVDGGGVVCVLELYSTDAPRLSERMMEVLVAVARELGVFFARRRGDLDLSPLTARELEVLTLAALGLSVSSIGERLTISRGTVKSHLEHIYGKLGVVNRTAAVAQALRTGLIE
ncbi:MAG TPA: LuxR C-terminal-related transcriptional regulator [Solirubrobacteraceae bacterium]|jgi:DNA-binding CsgD family transcriptional regulator|nr:LuxR C-terminal-related transcriptional regulator [Solirubrobacteraceae bacterium]